METDLRAGEAHRVLNRQHMLPFRFTLTRMVARKSRFSVFAATVDAMSFQPAERRVGIAGARAMGDGPTFRRSGTVTQSCHS